jgi:pimeloyl-ACP methyl ester carboxylesterase
MALARATFDIAFRVSGFRAHWIPTSEGWIRYWLHVPQNPDPDMLPTVFIHGVGLGAAPYLPFLQRLRKGRQALLVALELPNCSRCSFQEVMPSASSFRDALERLLWEALHITAPGSYMLVGHSLGTDFCSMVMNDPRLVHGDSPLRPARLVLMDPVCFAHEIAEAHRLPFWTVREALAHCGERWWRLPIQLMILLLVIRDEYNQEATKRAIVPGTDTIFRCPASLLKLCPVLVCLSGNDQAVPAWKIHDYLREHFAELDVRIDPGLEHGGFLMPTSPSHVVNSHAKDVLAFLSQQAALPKVSSDHGGNLREVEESSLMKRKSRSDLDLKRATLQA